MGDIDGEKEGESEAVATADPGPVFNLQDLADLARGNSPTQRQCQQDP